MLGSEIVTELDDDAAVLGIDQKGVLRIEARNGLLTVALRTAPWP